MKRVKVISYRGGKRIVYYRTITAKQRRAARKNVKKAKKKWMSMSHKARAKAMPGPYKVTKVRKKVAFGRRK